jgi:hypothetical protein
MALVVPMASVALLVGSTAVALIRNDSDNTPPKIGDINLEGSETQLKSELAKIQLERKATLIWYNRKLDEIERKKRLRTVVTIGFASFVSIIALTITLFYIFSPKENVSTI